jgi:hypothetical protein
MRWTRIIMDNMLSYHIISTKIKHKKKPFWKYYISQIKLEDRQDENDEGNHVHFDMNHLIDWCQVSSISALFLTELLLQAVNSRVSKKEIRHCIRAVSWLFDCWKTQMVVSVYFVMIHQQSFLTDSFHNLFEFCCCYFCVRRSHC